MRLTAAVRLAGAACLGALAGAPALAQGDWPMWGGDPSRNMSAKGPAPVAFDPGKPSLVGDVIPLESTKGVKWIAKLGSQSYGNVTIAGGRVFVGTNNEAPRDPDYQGDFTVLMCFNEADGAFQWQLATPKLGAGKVSDWEFLGLCSSPLIDGDRVYIVTTRGEAICLDVKGQADGNQGFPYEKLYMANTLDGLIENKKLPAADDASLKLDPNDADILWRFDLRAEVGIFPHNTSSNSALMVGDTIYIGTSNGVDWSHLNIPAPQAPAIIGLNKESGELVGEEASGISTRLMHSNWSSPTWGIVGGQPQLIFGAGDGHIYGLDPKTVKNDAGYSIFPELWRYDATKKYRLDAAGKPIKYATHDGPSEIIGTPVFYDGKIYVAIGQDPEHGEGIGNLVCIDPSKKGDITESGKAWEYDKIERTVSTVAIAEGLVFAADYTGNLHCVDAKTGQAYWVHNTNSHIWGSPLVAGGHVYLGNESGVLTIVKAAKELQVVAQIEMFSPIYSTPVVANGVLYIATQTNLYAIGGAK